MRPSRRCWPVATLYRTSRPVFPAFEVDSGGREKIDDTGFGYFLDAGVVWRQGRWFNLGLDVRYSDASVDFDGESFEAGGFAYGLFVGGRW